MNKTWYRGTPNRTNDASNFKGDIIWFTSDYKYAKSYANAYKGIVVKAELDCDNTFDAGVTDDTMCRLFPINYPFKLSPKMLELIHKLNMNEKEFWDVFSSLEKDKSEFYQYKIFTLVRTTQFRDLLISKGYDSVRTIEFGSECLGVFNTNQIKLKNDEDNIEGLDRLFKKIYNIDVDENKRGSKTMKKINENISSDLKKSKLADYLGVDEEEIQTISDNKFEVDEAEYLVCDEDEAYSYASEDIQNTFDDLGLDSFTNDFRAYILRYYLNEDWIEDILREDLYDMFEGDEDIPSDKIDDYVDNKLDEIGDPVEYLIDEYGYEFLNDVIHDNPGILDMEKVIDSCIDEYGIAYFIAYYDGKEIDLGDGLVAYRQN